MLPDRSGPPAGGLPRIVSRSNGSPVWQARALPVAWPGRGAWRQVRGAQPARARLAHLRASDAVGGRTGSAPKGWGRAPRVGRWVGAMRPVRTSGAECWPSKRRRASSCTGWRRSPRRWRVGGRRRPEARRRRPERHRPGSSPRGSVPRSPGRPRAGRTGAWRSGAGGRGTSRNRTCVRKATVAGGRNRRSCAHAPNGPVFMRPGCNPCCTRPPETRTVGVRERCRASPRSRSWSGRGAARHR